MKFTVCAGHGGSDPGAVFGKYKERDLMTDLRYIVSLKLRELGHEVLNDGDRWTNLPLAAALPLIGHSQLAVELHVNAGPEQARGVESLSLARIKPAAQKISAAIASVLDSPLRGDKGWRPQEESARKKLAFVNQGGIIVETFFLTNAKDREAYLEKQWLVASGIAKAMVESVSTK